VAWERIGTKLRCKEHDVLFAIGRRCAKCPPPGSGRPARDASPIGDSTTPPLTAERAAAAAFLANAPAFSDSHPILSREGRMAAAAELYDKAEASINEGLQQAQMNAIKEARQCIALVETLSGTAEVAMQVKQLTTELAELRARMDGAGDNAPVPPMDEGVH
jgi:hypothetical protein